MRRAMAVGALLAGAWAVDAYRRAERLRFTHRILVDLLLNALTADDPLTARHSRRVADLTYVLACARGMHGREVATLRVAALLHDLGKIDDRFWDIVHSRERLTPEQREEMEQHPDQSARILEPLEALHPGLSGMVGSHHEAWDGSGYPDGLRGEQIPCGARLIAVADVFDAMTQPRSYKGAISVEEVMGKIRELSGRQFDPEVVALLDAPGVRGEWERIARLGLEEEREGRGRKEMVSDSRDR
jgi:HD-GYP domain-containing protein (c-di-GMP phosphodiesterase class II)